MAWKSLKEDTEVKDLKGQLKGSVKIEQYRISNDALFLPKKLYIPIDSIEKIQIRRSQMNTTNCCGMSFPVYNVIVFYGGKKPEKIMFEKNEHAQEFADLILMSRKSIVWEDYVPPYQEYMARENA